MKNFLKMESNFERQLAKLNHKYNKDVENLSKESEKLNKLEYLFEQKEKSYLKLQEELSQMRSNLEKTTIECQSLRREMAKYIVSKTPIKRFSEVQEQSLSRVKNNKSILFDNSRKVSTSKKKSHEILFTNKHTDSNPTTESKQMTIRTTLYHVKRHGLSHSDYIQPHHPKKIYT